MQKALIPTGGLFLTTEIDFYDLETLIERLGPEARENDRPIVFLFGSAICLPETSTSPGVPGAAGIVDLIRSRFKNAQSLQLTEKLADASNQYQEAFRFMVGRRSPEYIGRVIRQAVLHSRLPSVGKEELFEQATLLNDSACEQMDRDTANWFIPRGLTAFGDLAVKSPKIFGERVLTTNFDPLIEIALIKAGGVCLRSFLHRDGNPSQTQGDGCHVTHLHGYWHGSDTLHSPRQLEQPRPRLKSYLSHLLAGKTLVVVGYSGWDDVFMQAVAETAADDSVQMDVVWACFEDKGPPKALLEILSPGIDRQRISFYCGIDCNEFLPALAEAWNVDVKRHRQAVGTAKGEAAKLVVSNINRDSPPRLDFYVGRETDLSILRESQARIIYITGIGGSGKSALAASYFGKSEIPIERRIWRDCKEENERFENQIIQIVSAINSHQTSFSELSLRCFEDIISLFVGAIDDEEYLFVFDNIDHYIDLDRHGPIGSLEKFCSKVAQECGHIKIILTCRPNIIAKRDDVLSYSIGGLGGEDVTELFQLRSAHIDEKQIQRILDATQGHALWLDLLAAQIADKQSSEMLSELEGDLSEASKIPTTFFNSIWEDLREREQIVLQTLAEAVRPVTLSELSSYVDGKIHFNQTQKAVHRLKTLSMVVFKDATDVRDQGIELHPVIKDYVRRNFKSVERHNFIHSILRAYKALFGFQIQDLPSNPSPSLLRYWHEGAELHIAAGEYGEAISCLNRISRAVRRKGQPREFFRVARLLLDNASWLALEVCEEFDALISDFIDMSALAGNLEECLSYLDSYASIIKGKEARYINLCDLRCYTYWANGDYLSAITSGTEGEELKKASGVDTRFDTSHNLALARRDAGVIAPALSYFLKGRNLDDVVAGKVRDNQGHFFGNIGRCLHLLGRSEGALSCYRQSARLIEDDESIQFETKAYIRQWSGELLSEAKDRRGPLFLSLAYSVWLHVSPPKAQTIKQNLINDGKEDVLNADSARKAASAWRGWTESS